MPNVGGRTANVFQLRQHVPGVVIVHRVNQGEPAAVVEEKGVHATTFLLSHAENAWSDPHTRPPSCGYPPRSEKGGIVTPRGRDSLRVPDTVPRAAVPPECHRWAFPQAREPTNWPERAQRRAR